MWRKPMDLESTLRQHIEYSEHALRDPDMYGVEVELEGQHVMGLPLPLQEKWFAHNDGSLRALKPNDQAIEYVFRRPMTYGETVSALDELFNFLETPPVVVYDSYRTSIHVHVNFVLETLRTIYNFITLSLILDELLTSQNGSHRVGNNFCLRAKDAMGQVISLCSSMRNSGGLFHINANERYSSINFVSLFKFGTIEFRSLECTTHFGRVVHWINTLTAMKAAARGFKNPIEIISQFSQLGPEEFLRKVLGPAANKYLRVTDRDEMLHNGMRIAQDFAYSSAWNEKEVA